LPVTSAMIGSGGSNPMSTTFGYQIHCRSCGLTITMRSAEFDDLCRRNREVGGSVNDLALVCDQCKTPQPCDPTKLHSDVLAEGSNPQKPLHPVSFSIPVECGQCDSVVVISGVRDHGTTPTQLDAEIASWKLDGMRCKNGHSIRRPALTSLSRIPE